VTLVSVIIPTYNRNDVLCSRALPSVFEQSHRQLDIHVLADGMRGEELDDLERRIREFHDPRLTLWNIPRQTYPEDPGERWCVLGLNARNIGLDHAKGEWIAPLDDDDAWTEDHIEVLLQAAVENKVDFAYGRSIAHWADGHTSSYGSWPPGHFQFCDGAQLYRNGMGYRYDPECITRGLPEDGDLWDRMVAGGVTFTFVNKVIHHYYPNPR
jgi:glycosyltransferase involved in cell wall biosynthesis